VYEGTTYILLATISVRGRYLHRATSISQLGSAHEGATNILATFKRFSGVNEGSVNIKPFRRSQVTHEGPSITDLTADSLGHPNYG